MEVKRDRLIFEGEVVDCKNSKFLVKVSEDYFVLCTLSGKLRQSAIKILLGDRCQIEAGAFDPTMGRIIYRNKLEK